MQVSIKSIALFVGVLALMVAGLISTSASPATAQTEATCDNPSNVLTFSDTDASDTASFSTTGRSFRMDFVTVRGSETDDPLLRVEITEENGQRPIDTFEVENGESLTETVSAGPGTFQLTILEETNVTYTITVDDCVSSNNNGGGGNGGGGNGGGGNGGGGGGGQNNNRSNATGDADDRQYGEEIIIKKTIVEGLPKTGGPSPLLLPWLAAFVVAGIAVVRRS